MAVFFPSLDTIAGFKVKPTNGEWAYTYYIGKNLAYTDKDNWKLVSMAELTFGFNPLSDNIKYVLNITSFQIW